MNPTDAKSSAFLLSLRGEKMKLPLTPPLPGLNMCLGILASCMLTKNPGRDSSDPPLLPPSWHEIKTIILGSIHWRLEPSQGFPCGSDGKESAHSAVDQGVWSLSWEDPVEEGIATHSSILAWRIPWTEEPGRLQSMGLQRVRHDWSDLAHTHRSISLIKKEISIITAHKHFLLLLFIHFPNFTAVLTP